MKPLVAQLRAAEEAIAAADAEIMAWHKGNEASRRLETIPGVGFRTASAIAANVPDPSFFRSGREFAAWLGLVPRQNSSGGPVAPGADWVNGLLERRPPRLVTVAMANKTARIALALLAKGGTYRAPCAAA